MERPQTTTMVITPTVTSAREQRTPVVLEANLRILRVPDTRRVTWQEGTIDNEGLQRKNSKCCCIYNKRRQYDGESSDDNHDDPRAGHTARHCSGL